MDVKPEIIEMTAEIVASYVENNTVPGAELPGLIQSVYRALSGVTTTAEVVEATPKEPAVPVRRSITPDYLVCLEDGRKFKSLKRHLRTRYNLSPEEYRAKWGLPKDYPMVAPNYAKARSDLAKQMGLGQGGRAAPTPKRK
jgi:predicted transcriptional regulator